MKHKIYLYPKWIRGWHLLNALLFVVLIVSGISLHFTDTNSPYFLIRFDRAVALHNFAAILLVINYMIFLTGNIFSKNGQHYRMKAKGLSGDLFKQFKYYAFDMFKKREHPFPVTKNRKFNPLQKVAYVFAMYFCMPLLILSGFFLLFPELIVNNIFGFSGLSISAFVHIIISIFLILFMMIHVYTCTLGAKPTTLFKSMITGYHEADHD